MDNLEEMDKFLERYNLLRLNQEEIENMNRPIRSEEHTSELQSLAYLVCRLLLEKKKEKKQETS